MSFKLLQLCCTEIIWVPSDLVLYSGFLNENVVNPLIFCSVPLQIFIYFALVSIFRQDIPMQTAKRSNFYHLLWPKGVILEVITTRYQVHGTCNLISPGIRILIH